MKKENMLKMLEIIYDEANNCITASRANNYWCIVNEMTTIKRLKASIWSLYMNFLNQFIKQSNYVIYHIRH